MKKLIIFISIFGLCVYILTCILISSAKADNPNRMLDDRGHIIGVQYTTITVNGKNYDVPIANLEYKNDLYFLKKALNGDKEALELFIGGGEKRSFFIGSDRVV